MWPRLYLSNYEKRYVDKYTNPETNRQVALRRMYKAELVMNETTRRPMATLDISRRTRVFGITFAGDVGRFVISLVDSAGEHYTADPIEVNLLQPGNTFSGTMDPTVFDVAIASVVPFIIEPNIVLAPNQSLKIQGGEVTPAAAEDEWTLEATFHVWEFPGMMGGAL